MALISIDKAEVRAIEKRGARVLGGLLVGTKDCRCGFQNRKTELCDLHNTGDKPLGCIASPFTLNKKRTLIVRHRYINLRCYNDGPRLPAYIAFRASLVALLGEEQTQELHSHLEADGGDKWLKIEDHIFDLLKKNDFNRRAIM
tara:strand:+ start:705 stop:1136 length:432 start_codon:yes stop_codon:yes gene_type:complete